MSSGWTIGSVSMVDMASMMPVIPEIVGVQSLEHRAMSIMEAMDVSIHHTMRSNLSITGRASVRQYIYNREWGIDICICHSSRK